MQPITLLLSTLLAVGGNPVLQRADTAIVGARLEIGDGRVVENGTIVIHDGKIAQIGSGLAAPDGATIIDGKGLTVYPGFVDAYSTTDLNLPEAPPSGKELPDTTTTAPATMWHENRKNLRANVHAATALDPKATFGDRTKQGITTVLFSGGSGSIAGTAALIDLTPKPTVIVPNAAEEFVFRGGGRFGGMQDEEMAAGGQGRRGLATTDTTPTYAYPGTLFGIVALTRQTLWDAKAYAADPKAKPEPTYDGLKPLVMGAMPALYTLNTSREIARAGHLSDEFGFRMVVNGPPDAYRMIDTLKAHNAPVIVSLEVPEAPTRVRSAGSAPQRVLDDRYQQYKERMTNAAQLDAAGVTIAFRKSPMDDYLTGVRKLVAISGLPRESALKAMTINPARIFGVADRMGTLETGKSANLTIMTGDFLDPKSQVKTTLVEGVATDAKKETSK